MHIVVVSYNFENFPLIDDGKARVDLREVAS